MLPPPPARDRATWPVALMLVAVVLAAYAPAFRAGFVWDDDAHVTAPALRSLAGLARIWSEPGATQQYYPLLHSAFWLEHRAFGDAPLGYHLVNLALHAAAALLFFGVLRRLAPAGAVLAALLFALHPLHVESVAWISEQKNTLSLVFYLAAVLAYLRFDVTRAPSAYVAAFGFFIAALLTKTVTATLPASLLVILWWQRRRLEWRRDISPLVAWFAIGACAGLFTAWTERKLIGAEGAAYDLSLVQRTLLAGRVAWFYLGKLFLPLDLTFIYPRWTLAPASLAAWLPVLGVSAVFAVLAKFRQRAALATALLFLIAQFPALGFFNIYPFIYSFVADHFAYLASLPVLALVGNGLARFGRAGFALGGVVTLGFAALTWRHAQDFQDNETLFRATVARNPDAWMAHNNLGQELLRDRARLPEAIACFQRALALRPEYFEAQNNLGLALAQAGRPAEAIPHLEAAVRLKPASFQALNNLGIALAGLGRAAEAAATFRRALVLNPTLPNLHENLSRALQLLGRPDEAAAEFARGRELRAATPNATAPRPPPP